MMELFTAILIVIICLMGMLMVYFVCLHSGDGERSGNADTDCYLEKYIASFEGSRRCREEGRDPPPGTVEATPPIPLVLEVPCRESGADGTLEGSSWSLHSKSGRSKFDSLATRNVAQLCSVFGGSREETKCNVEGVVAECSWSSRDCSSSHDLPPTV